MHVLLKQATIVLCVLGDNVNRIMRFDYVIRFSKSWNILKGLISLDLFFLSTLKSIEDMAFN